MTVSTSMELHVVQAIEKLVAEGLGSETALQETGERAPAAGVDDWARVSILSFREVPASEGVWCKVALVQVAFFSRIDRADGNGLRPHELAALGRSVIEGAKVTVYATAKGNAFLAAGTFSSVSGPTYIDEGTVAGFAGGPSEPTNVHGAVITARLPLLSA